MKGYEIFRKTIEELKLSPMFGNPGSTEIPILRGVGDYVLTLHDSISVGMADGLAQYSGRPAIANLHTLPGVANSMSFIHTARLNHSPIIVTSGQQDSRHAFYEPLLWHDLQSLVGNAVKYFYEVKNGEDIERVMKRAYSISMEPPAGPVFVSFPMDVVDEDAEYRNLPYSVPNTELIDHGAVEKVLQLIMQASNPALIAGAEVDQFNANEELEKFASILGIPVYTEPLSNRAGFNSESMQNAGDLPPATTAINLALIKHDLILNFGGEFTLYPYLPSPLLPGKKVVTVTMTPSYRFGEYITGNPKLFLMELNKSAEKKGDFVKSPDNSLTNLIARERRVMGASYLLQKAKKEFSGHIIVDEAISSSLLVRKHMGYSPRSYFTAKSGQLGWGMPAAAGISLKVPRVLEIVGDGSIMYTIQTLWTISNYNLPVKILVLDNGGYTILKSFSASFYPGLEKAPYLTFSNNILKIAESFGVESREADPDLNELKWLSQGDSPKLLVAKVPKTIPKLFI